jgi:hypothetical protein
VPQSTRYILCEIDTPNPGDMYLKFEPVACELPQANLADPRQARDLPNREWTQRTPGPTLNLDPEGLGPSFEGVGLVCLCRLDQLEWRGLPPGNRSMYWAGRTSRSAPLPTALLRTEHHRVRRFGAVA